MSNVFVCHSSQDKVFVRRLATKLLSHGFPVWLDSWSLEIGDTLIDGIYNGIDQSSFVLVVLSKQSIESGWVNREVNAALQKEDQIGRKFLIPIKIDNCQPPLKIADRLYADFSGQFSAPFQKLAEVLEKYGCQDLNVAPDRELLALRFDDEVHLDRVSLQTSLSHLKRRNPKIELKPWQVILDDDPAYKFLREKLHTRIDNVASDRFYSPQLKGNLQLTLNAVEENDKLLRKGVALLVNNRPDLPGLYWFARILRGRNAYQLWSAQSPDHADALDYGKEWYCAFLFDNASAAKFWEIGNVKIVAVWRKSDDETNHISMWIGAEDVPGLFDDNVYTGPSFLIDACSYASLDKYIYPQMVYQHLISGTSLFWNLRNVLIGVS